MPKRGRKRWRDPGYPCRDCEQYYNSFPEEERNQRIQASCRHRSEAPPPPRTPPGFWDLDFPSSPEIIASGAMLTEDMSHIFHRRRALNPYAEAKRHRHLKRMRLKYGTAQEKTAIAPDNTHQDEKDAENKNEANDKNNENNED